MYKRFILFLVVMLLATGLILSVSILAFSHQHEAAGKKATPATETEAPSLAVKGLPEGVVKISPSVPGMGEHWANPDDLPLRPIYLVYKGELTGIEFMYSQDMLPEVRFPIPEWAEGERKLYGEEMVLYELANVKVDHLVDHIDIAFMPKGHEGFEVPHWDIHIWFVSHDLHMLIPGEAPPQE